MRFRFVVAGFVVATAVGLAGCTAPTAQSGFDAGSAVTVAGTEGFSSSNASTSFGATTANSDIAYLTNDWFNYYDNTPKLVKDESFGSYEVLSEDPLTVKYTVAQGTKWSDGVAVDAADLLLDWAANSRALDTPGFDPAAFTDPETGAWSGKLPSDVVHFDSGGRPDLGLGLVHQTPTIGDGGRSLTMVYSAPFPDWELALPRALPAHVVGKKALGGRDGKSSVIRAIEGNDVAALSKISSFWNSGFDFSELPDDPELSVGTGPYTISALKAGQITLRANPEYTGEHKPSIEQISIRVIGDPLAAVQALRHGDVDVISPRATPDIASALAGVDGMTVLTGADNSYEHLDLQVDKSRNGVFADPRVREAFLKTVPRQKILDELIKPIAGADARLRDSLVFAPGAAGQADSVGRNGSADFAHVDIAGAKAILAAAGAQHPEVCLLYASDNPRRVREFALIQASADSAGFQVTDCGSAEWSGLLGTPGAYDAALFGWPAPTLATSSTVEAFVSGGLNNFNFLSDPDIDAVAHKLRVELDPGGRIALQQQLDALVWKNHSGVPLFQFPTVAAFNNHKLQGVSPSVLPPSIFWNFWDWTAQ